MGRFVFPAIVRTKSDWDEVLDDLELGNKWSQWCSEVVKCEGVQVARTLLPSETFPVPNRCLLVGFSDGSSLAHGCTLYLRWADKDEENTDVKFGGAKGKLNPIKGTTVPRSEIGGAFILSRLTYSAEMAFSETELKSQIDEKILFTDSTTVLSWVKSAAIKYKPFVRNKIIEMQELHPINVWEYVPSTKNTTADLISKGCTRKDLDKIIRGPDFLYTPRNKWPKGPLTENKEEMDAEKIPNMVINAVSMAQEEPPIDIERFGSWKKLIRVTAFVFRFGIPKVDENNAPTSIAEIAIISEEERCKAERYWIAQAQNDFSDELKTENLVPF